MVMRGESPAYSAALLNASKLRLQPVALPVNSAAIPLFGRLIPLFGRVGNFASELNKINTL